MKNVRSIFLAIIQISLFPSTVLALLSMRWIFKSQPCFVSAKENSIKNGNFMSLKTNDTFVSPEVNPCSLSNSTQGHQGPEYLSLYRKASLILIYWWVPIYHFEFLILRFQHSIWIKDEIQTINSPAQNEKQCRHLGHVTSAEIANQKPFPMSKSCVTNLTIILTNFFYQVAFPMIISTSYYESKFINIDQAHFSQINLAK